ncbi:MAG: hypothetical protein ACXVDI_24245 [Ktedonobacterales bacterium]
MPRTNRLATPLHSTALLLEGTTLGLKIASNTMRGIFVINLILGIIFWTGNEPGGILLLHMLLGLIFVAALWYIGTIAALRGGTVGLQVGAFVLGLLIALLGLFQRQLLPGGAHWVIQVLHLLLAVLGIGLAEMIGAQLRRAGAATAAK